MDIDLSAAAEPLEDMIWGAVALLPSIVLALLVFAVFLLIAKLVRAGMLGCCGDMHPRDSELWSGGWLNGPSIWLLG